ncbi:MAG: hypothetical protein JW814_11650 [Candidatus Krumholzibacteriota bacterium]|nr:hypothetical protein [Candidatus Krumholzibacteriota bacterium]
MRSANSILMILLIAGASLLFSPEAVYSSDENIEAGSWVYSALRSFELAGFVNLPPDIPFTRTEVEYHLNTILERLGDDGEKLSPRLDFLLERLKKEFLGKEKKPTGREDTPLWSIREGKRYLLFDLAAGSTVQKRPERDNGEVDGLAIPSILADLGQGVTFFTSYRLKMQPERDSNTAGVKPSARERSFRGLTSEYERAYLSITGDRWRVLIGRDHINWGNGRDEGLVISRSAGSLDQAGVSVSLGRFRLTTLQVLLDPQSRRRMAGHRLTVRLPAGAWLGVSETVLYSGRDLDYSYLLPAGSYYANQYNERDDDNILVGIDWKIPLFKSVITYGELLIDDFQYEDRGDAPDRLGYDVCVEGRLCCWGREIELGAEYTRIDIFTYAHKEDLLTRYVTGNGDQYLNPPIGSPLGPDSDRWRVRAAAAVHRRVVISTAFEYVRRGEGNDFREWDRTEDPDPAFPSGALTIERDLSLTASLDLGRGSLVRAGGGIRVIDGPGDDDEETGFGWFEILLDF